MTIVLTWLRHGSNAVLLLGLVVLAVLFGTRDIALVWWCVPIGVAATPQSSAIVRGLQHRLHYDHHVDPPRLDLLFLPLWFVIPTAAIFLCVYWGITRNVAVTASLLFGSIFALTYYEWVHYVAHIAYVPPITWGKWMKKYHLWHHYKNEKLWFGVTNPTMDFVGVTYSRVSDAEKSATTRDLGHT